MGGSNPKNQYRYFSRTLMIAKYEFKKLDTEKANALSRKLGFNAHFTEPQVLTDIFNQEEQATKLKERKVVGFR